MEDDRYTRITLRIPKDLHQRLDEQADRTSKSLNAEIVNRLEASFVDNLRRTEVMEKKFARLERERDRLENARIRYFVHTDRCERLEAQGAAAEAIGEARNHAVASWEEVERLKAEVALLELRLTQDDHDSEVVSQIGSFGTGKTSSAIQSVAEIIKRRHEIPAEAFPDGKYPGSDNTPKGPKRSPNARKPKP